MSGTDTSLTELLEQTIGVALETMAGPLMGSVQAYDSSKDTVSVAPLVPLFVGDTPVTPPVIQSVPMEWAGAGGMTLKFPILSGDLVRLVPFGHDHDAWITTGTPGVPPETRRRFSLADLVARPVSITKPPVVAGTNPPPNSYDPLWAVLWGQLIVGNKTAADFVAIAAKVLSELTAIKTWADGHTHVVPGAVTGGPGITSNAPTNPMPSPSSVEATKLKAE